MSDNPSASSEADSPAEDDPTPVACAACFMDRGLRLDAERIGQPILGECPNCGALDQRKLTLNALGTLAHRFFVWGSLSKQEYGAAPVVQFNEHQKTSINVAPWLSADVALFERILGVGFFHYGPRLWMIGEVEPLKALQQTKTRPAIVARVMDEYPERYLSPGDLCYRVRVNPTKPADPAQYDSPPPGTRGKGRFNTPSLSILYASPDLHTCVHECRVTAEDDLYVATLAPARALRLLDLSVLLKEDGRVSEFESLDMAVHMLFLAGQHSYGIAQSIADAARTGGFDGIIYPSYFSLLRLGQMPFQTIYGISHRRIPQLQDHEQAKAIPNLALFGRPIADGVMSVQCINRLILSRVEYDFHFGPADV